MSRNWRSPEQAKAVLEQARQRGMLEPDARYHVSQERHPVLRVKQVAAPVPIVEKTKAVKKMTRTEEQYEAMLRKEWPGCRILFERYTLKLSNDCRYSPDFAVVHVDGEQTIDFHEVKGAFLFRGATKSSTHTSLTKPKLAAENYPWHRFYVAKRDENGNWSREWFKGAS